MKKSKEKSISESENDTIENKQCKCNHENAYWFHENAPAYCPDCKKYLETIINNRG